MQNRPSDTAAMIAVATVQLAGTRDAEGLIHPDALLWSERFVDELRGRRGAAAKLRNPLRRLHGSVREAVSVPAIRLHYLMRKRWIEEAVRKMIAEDCTQVVVLAAGFDTLAIRLCSEFKNVLFVELDHPSTQKVKKAAIQKAAVAFPNDNFLLLPIDFTKQRPGAVLSSVPRFDFSRKTLFVAEGIFMYLRESEIDQLLGSLLSGSGRRHLIFTFFEVRADGRIGFRRSSFVTDLWLRLKGEPFVWACDPEKLEEFLSRRGFRLNMVATSSHFRGRYLRDRPDVALAEGENVAVAERIETGLKSGTTDADS